MVACKILGLQNKEPLLITVEAAGILVQAEIIRPMKTLGEYKLRKNKEELLWKMFRQIAREW